jgi:hypothetical protein
VADHISADIGDISNTAVYLLFNQRPEDKWRNRAMTKLWRREFGGRVKGLRAYKNEAVVARVSKGNCLFLEGLQYDNVFNKPRN